MVREYPSNGSLAHALIGRFRYIAWVKCPYRVAGKASALRAGKRAPGRMPIQSCRQSVSARRGKRYTEIGLFLLFPRVTVFSYPGKFARVQHMFLQRPGVEVHMSTRGRLEQSVASIRI